MASLLLGLILAVVADVADEVHCRLGGSAGSVLGIVELGYHAAGVSAWTASSTRAGTPWRVRACAGVRPPRSSEGEA